MKQYHGQNLEDKLVDELFNGEIHSVLDIGANGIELSNTYYFVQNGAKAVLVEPSNKAMNNLADIYEGNKNVDIFNVAIGEKCGVMPFWESGSHLKTGDVALLSTLKESELKRWEGSDNQFEKTDVHVWDFKKLMEYSPLKQFDLISIDAEGFDICILQQMDLKELGCKCLIIEYNGDEEAKIIIDAICTHFRMKLYHSNAENLIYVAE